MPRVDLALALALLGCVFTLTEPCEWVNHKHVRPGGMMMPSQLEPAHALEVSACRERCCNISNCDTVVHEPLSSTCHLLHCDGKCVFQKDDSDTHSVFVKSDAPPPGGALHIEPLILDTKPRGEEQRNNKNNSSDVCALPRVVGMCKAAFPRFFYDSEAKTCRSFIYGGCGANANNFDSLSECQETCGGGGVKGAEGESPSERKTLRMVALPPGEEEGDGEEEEEEAHKAKEMSSDEFKGVKVLLPDTRDDFKVHCTAAPDSGPCRAMFPMFYYDPEAQSCKRFVYGGCRGNDNRYDSEGECEERCANQGRSRWTTAFFLFLTLAGVSFLLLTALIFITMRRRRDHAPRRTLPIRSDKEELLPDSERSSVDSLPLPESPNKP